MYHQLNEGLRSLDLTGTIDDLFEIDTYRSKMGEDEDVCVLSLTAKDRYPARDLMDFVEKAYHFILDADVSSGEDKNGNYHVFIEIPRTPQIAENIKELSYGIKKLTGIDDFKFKYHKKDAVYDLTENNLKTLIPETSYRYKEFMSEVKTEHLKNFFNKTLMDDLDYQDDIITIFKPFDQQIKLRLVTDEENVIVEGGPSVDENSTAEIFWLTKVLGDYNISKFGDKFLFSNRDRQMLLQRID